jgi:hypothetical protein
LSIVATLLMRLKRLLYSHSRDLQKGKGNLSEHAIEIEMIESFLIWIQTHAVSGIYKTASYTRITYSVGVLKEYSLMEDYTFSSENTEISRKLILESNPRVVDTLLFALNIHGGAGAFELLSKFDSPLLGFEDTGKVRSMIDAALEKVWG